MHNHVMLPAVLTALVALVLVFLGVRIALRGDVHLIAGYDSARVADPVGLGRLVGGTCIGIGVALLAMTGSLVMWPGAEGILTVGFAAVAIVGILVILATHGRYSRGPNTPIVPDPRERESSGSTKREP